jgi:hypothetical protein
MDNRVRKLECCKNAQQAILFERRSITDRRKKGSISIRSLLFGGRRETIRRHEDRSKFFYVDRYSQFHFVAIVLILFLSAVDAILTIELMNHGAYEVNPVMAYCLDVGPYTFLSIKYALTCVGLILLLMLRNIFMKPLGIFAGSFFYYLLAAFIGAVSWQFFLLFRTI